MAVFHSGIPKRRLSEFVSFADARFQANFVQSKDMIMKSYRIGNTITVKWTLMRPDGTAYELTPGKIELFASTPNHRIEISEFTVSDNVVTWRFDGDKQKYPGPYTLTLIENRGEPDMMTVDFCEAFALVQYSCLAGGADTSGVTTEAVELSSEVSMTQIGLSPEVKEEIENAISVFKYPDGSPVVKASEGVLEFLNSLGHTVGQIVHTEADGTKKNYAFWGWTGNGQIILFEPSKITVRSDGKDAMTFTSKFKNVHYWDEDVQTGPIAIRVSDNTVEIRSTSGKTLANFNPSYVTFYNPSGKAVIESSLNAKSLILGNVLDVLSFKSAHDEVSLNGKELAFQEDVDKKVDKVKGKGLSTNDYTNEEKQKVADAQPKTDESLKTTAKTVTGAINELEDNCAKKKHAKPKLVVGKAIPIHARPGYKYVSSYVKIKKSSLDKHPDIDISSFLDAGAEALVVKGQTVAPRRPEDIGCAAVPAVVTKQYFTDNPGVDCILLNLRPMKSQINKTHYYLVTSSTVSSPLTYSKLLRKEIPETAHLCTTSPNIVIRHNIVCVIKPTVVRESSGYDITVIGDIPGHNLKIYYTRRHYMGGNRMRNNLTKAQLPTPRRQSVKMMKIKNLTADSASLKNYLKHLRSNNRGRKCIIEIRRRCHAGYLYVAERVEFNARKSQVTFL